MKDPSLSRKHKQFHVFDGHVEHVNSLRVPKYGWQKYFAWHICFWGAWHDRRPRYAQFKNYVVFNSQEEHTAAGAALADCGPNGPNNNFFNGELNG